jgi:Uma2 family endonuclease
MTTTTAPPPRLALPAKYDNAAEWLHALGDVPLERIVMSPWPGTATEQDLLRYVDGDDKRLVELVDGTLVEKCVGWIEGLLAAHLITILNNFVIPRRLGAVAGADATLRMKRGNIRLPGVTFVSVSDLPGGKAPKESVPLMPPTLAVEVISEGNTKAEMRRKAIEYFESGARLLWLIYPESRTVAVYHSASEHPTRMLNESDILDGGDVLPGFTVPVTELFEPLAK